MITWRDRVMTSQRDEEKVDLEAKDGRGMSSAGNGGQAHDNRLIQPF